MRGCRLEVRLYFLVDIISNYFPELHWSLTHVKHTLPHLSGAPNDRFLGNDLK